MNRYITLLLIALAATGVEAQAYQAALRQALAEMPYEQMALLPEAQALEDDVLLMMRALASEATPEAPAPSRLAAPAPPVARQRHATPQPRQPQWLPGRHAEPGIVIRGPDN